VLAAKPPDAPLNVQNNAAVTAANVIGFSWTPGTYNGGSPVIDYTISYDGATNNYMVLATGVTSLSYTASLLTAGLTYKFKI